MSSLLSIVLFLSEIIGIYFLSRIVLQMAYRVLNRYGGRKTVIIILAILYEPGTIIHELSHYFVALLLNMHPQEVSIFPQILGNKIRLGHVIYSKDKSDFIRPILVGIAPLFGGLAVLLLIVYSKMFPGTQAWQTLLFGYLILTITANMFSSSQDLVDIIYILPVIIGIFLIIYLFHITLDPSVVQRIQGALQFFIQAIQPALLFSLAFHAILGVALSRFK